MLRYVIKTDCTQLVHRGKRSSTVNIIGKIHRKHFGHVTDTLNVLCVLTTFFQPRRLYNYMDTSERRCFKWRSCM